MVTFTIDTSVKGVLTVPLGGEIFSQLLPPDVVLATAFQFIVPCPMLRIPKLCGSGDPPCSTALKLKPLCEIRMVALGLAIDSVTATLVVAPPLVMAIVPL